VSYQQGTVVGNYRIEELLGTGGVGQVFRATHVVLEQPAALKILHTQFAGDPTFLARFKREARISSTLRHANIVETYDAGIDHDLYFLVMELIADGSLRELLQQQATAGAPLPLPVGIDLICQAARGLGYAHDQHVVHRDVKPDNLLLTRTPADQQTDAGFTVKLSDFGLGRIAEEGLATAQGATVGTPAYMSPEQCQGLELDSRSDIYSLGVILYEVTTGYLPFDTKRVADAIFKHVMVEPPVPRSVRPNLPERLEAVILRCLRKAPAERYQTAWELVDELETLRPLVAAPVAPPPAPEPAPTLVGVEIFDLTLGRERLTLLPGGSVELPIAIANRGSAPLSLSLALDGVPREWLRYPPMPVQVPAGTSATATIGIALPAGTTPASGEHRLTLLGWSTTSAAEPRRLPVTLLVQAPGRESPFVPSKAAAPAGPRRSTVASLLLLLVGLVMIGASAAPWISYDDGTISGLDRNVYFYGDNDDYTFRGDGWLTAIAGAIVVVVAVLRLDRSRFDTGAISALATLALVGSLGVVAFEVARAISGGFALAPGPPVVALAALVGLVVLLAARRKAPAPALAVE
jgi:serine/threonine protein kinase